MDFGNLLTRSWNIVWNNKFLIVFGFLAALGGGGGGSSSANFSFGRNRTGFRPGIVDDAARFIRDYGGLLIGLTCVVVVIFIILWLLRLTAQGGLISAASSIDAGETATFSDTFTSGTSHLPRLAGLNLLLYGPFALLGLLAGAVFLATIGGAVFTQLSDAPADLQALFGGTAIILACFACLTCLLVPVLIVVTAIYPFAQRGVVLQNMGVIDSVRHGWQILKENLANIILLIVLFVVLNLIFGFAVAIILIPFAVLSMGPAVIDMIANHTFHVRDLFLAAGGGICLGLVGAAVSSIMISFRSTAVTLAYKEFVQKQA